jgi:uncharacterized membrane protein YphA (DoxX/SURF4 family)
MVALGFCVFLLIGLMAFWCLAFLMGFVIPFWVTLGTMKMLRPKRLVEESAE